MTELVEEAIACGEIVADIKATHVASHWKVLSCSSF